MKVLLLEHPRAISPERCNDIANTPLTSCMLSGYVASLLQSRGHVVEIVEGHMDSLSYQQLESIIRRVKPDILGAHMVYHWQDDEALYTFMQMVKKEGLAKYVTAFGFYPTIAFEDILQKCTAVDSVVVGEPELTFAELVATLEAKLAAETKTTLRFRTIGLPGLAYRDSAGQVTCQRRPLIEELDSLPMPVRTEAAFRLPEVNLQGSRGCYGSCTFCYINPFYGQGSRWRGRSPENIVAEIDGLIKDKGVRNFYFTDPNFFGPGKVGQARALHLAALLKPRNIRFGIEGRVNDIHPETISALVDAGLRHILIGLESGKDSSLKRMNKMTTVAQNERAIRILRENGIEPNIGFIMFEPEASLEDVQVNFEFLKRNSLLSSLVITANLLYHHQIILKGTPAYKILQETGRLVLDNNSSYEGQTHFSNPQVAMLAEIMRKITNFLFNRMSGIWGGKVPEPQDAGSKYAKVNQILLEVFGSELELLLSGQQLNNQQIDHIAAETNEKIVQIIG